MDFIRGINHITLPVRNLEESFFFYGKVLGLKPLAKRKGKSAYFLAGADWVALVQAREPFNHSSSYGHLAFSVSLSDFPDLCERLHAAGAPEWQENTSPGESFYFLDPSGNKLEIHVGDWTSRMQWLKENPSADVEIFAETESSN